MREKFFVMDSDGLDDVQSAMYGLAFDSKSFITDINAFDETVYREYSGSFIAVKKTDDAIRIYQDMNGTHGIYLYEEGAYFALSNSFILLFEYLHFRKNKKLELNYGYACHLLTIPMCSLAYTSTLCRQIRILPPTVEVTIQLGKKILSTSALPVSPAVDICSEEALAIIDRWISKWTSLLQNLQAQNLFTEVDVTGGMDSRVTLALALAADVDRSKINFCSAESYHVKDDFLIARALAAAFGFSLNSQKYQGSYTHAPLSDSWDMSMLPNLGIHHYPYFKNSAFRTSFFKITGQGGETIRNHWYVEPHSLESEMICGDISKRNISLHAAKFLWGELIELNKTHPGDSADGYKKLVHNFYNEGRARYHFGRNIAASHLINYIVLAPLFDAELRKINCISQGNNDYNLLIALIMVRINRHLVEFPFNNRKIFSSDCIARAVEINRKSKLVINSDAYTVPENIVTYIPDSCHEKERESPMDRLKRLVSGPDIRDVISQSFGRELYDACIDGFDRPGVHPEKGAFKLLAVAGIASPSAPVLMGFDELTGAAGNA